MSKLTDPDSYSINVNGTPTTEEVAVLTGPQTIQLRVAGNLDDTAPGKTSGGTAKSIYSHLKEEWLVNTILRRFKFPIKMIFEGSFIWVNGWGPADQQTRDLFRDAGQEEQVSGNINACMISLGAINAPSSDLAYFTQATGFTAATTDYDKTGELNENIDITGLTTFQKSHLRIQGKVYSEYSLLVEQGLSSIGFQAYSFPLTNSLDSKIVDTDANVDTIEPFLSMVLNYLKGTGFTTYADTTVYPVESVVLDGATGRWFFTVLGGTSSGANVAADVGVTDWVAYFGEALIGSTYYAFNRVLDANLGSNDQGHTFSNRQLRLAGDINDNVGITAGQGAFGAVNGKVAELLTEYVGNDLFMKPGTLIKNFDPNSKNNIKHQPITVDTGGLSSVGVPIVFTEVSFPFVSAGTFKFSDNYVTQPDIDTNYTVYFDFITSTTGSYTLTLSSGSIGNLTWSGTDLDHVIVGDHIDLSGWITTPAMNTLYLVNTVGANTMNVTAVDNTVLVTETATVQVDQNPYESPTAVVVNDNSGTPMDAQISSASIVWDFDFTNNNQGGRTPNTAAACTIIAISKDGAEWVDAQFTINQATGIDVPVNGGDERNYGNAI